MFFRDRNVARDADIVVGHAGDYCIAHTELSREVALRILRHVDDISSPERKHLAFCHGRKTRPLDHDDRTLKTMRLAELLEGV